MAEEITEQTGVTLVRQRPRITSLRIDKQKIAERVRQFYDDDMQDRAAEIEARLQRYAKFRMWTEGKDWPWESACFSLDSELLTADGWKPVGDMQAGDLAYTRAPDGKAEYRPVAYTVRTRATQAVTIKGKSIDLRVTPNHRILITDWSGKTRFVLAGGLIDAPNRGWSIPLTSAWSGETPATISGMDAKAYVRLLGWYISEGSANNGGSLSISQSPSANAEKCEIIERDLADAHITWKRSRSDYWLHSSTVVPVVREELLQLGAAHEKRLPDYVLSLSPALLGELFGTMIGGDGHVRANGHRSYYTTSRALADQVQIIAQKIGLRARIIRKDTIGKGGSIRGRKIKADHDIYVVNINRKPSVQVRKVAITLKEGAVEEFACVNVPPHNTLYVRRNGVAAWCGNTDAAIPDMMTASMRLQDTLHNAVLSHRPPVMARATKKVDQEKEEKVSYLIDYQVFEEQPGEEIIGQLADDFVNEGLYTAYVPWVKETRSVRTVTVHPPVPGEILPSDYFRELILGSFPRAILGPSEEGWDWTIIDGKKQHKASFFTRGSGEIEMELEHEALVYDGPRVIRKDIQDVLHPARCENLQIPGPSNPLGASHVILRDFPTVDELRRLSKPDKDGNRYYDLMEKDDYDQLGVVDMDTSHQQREEQKDTMQGMTEQRDKPKGAESHKPLTRLMCFDCYDINGDGVDEDVIWWMILETKTLLRAKYLTQMFPSSRPRRPFAEAGLFPVPGRRFAIGLLEMMEGLHDLQKQFFDQGGDAGTITNSPFFFYRAASNMRPEVIRLWPGEGYPLSDPRNDVNFPTMGDRSQAFTFNMVALLQQMEERLTTIGELQLGRVPQGKASALRTVAGMQTILAQGDARPERVLRRFFLGLTQIWQQIHMLNQTFLPKDKQYMIAGYSKPGKDPYQQASISDISGEYRFTFSANALNTSKEALQASLQQLLGTYVSELNIMLGIIDADGIYRLERDWGKALGPDPDKYLKPPSTMAPQPKIFIQEAIDLIISGQMPEAAPAEGAEAHLQALIEFSQSDNFGHIPTPHVSLFRAYMERTVQLAMQERQQAALLAAVSKFQPGGQGPGKPGPAAGPQVPEAQAPLQPNELLQEDLPSSGGGANAGVA